MISASRRATAASVLLGLLAASPALAADPHGLWLTESGKSKIRIVDCGGALCGAVEWLREPNDPETGKPRTDRNNADASLRSRPVVGVAIVLSMKPNGPDKWEGQVYNAEDGKTYSGNITMRNASMLRLEGCTMGGLLCKGQIWSRAN